jgi:hypothetical protein
MIRAAFSSDRPGLLAVPMEASLAAGHHAAPLLCSFVPDVPASHRAGCGAARPGRVFLSSRAEADFQAWRDQRDWTAEKYRRFDRGERMPACVRLPRRANVN